MHLFVCFLRGSLGVGMLGIHHIFLFPFSGVLNWDHRTFRFHLCYFRLLLLYQQTLNKLGPYYRNFLYGCQQVQNCLGLHCGQYQIIRT